VFESTLNYNYSAIYENLNCGPLIGDNEKKTFASAISRNIALMPIEMLPEIVMWPRLSDIDDSNLCNHKQYSKKYLQNLIDEDKDYRGFETNLNVDTDFVLHNVNGPKNISFIRNTDWNNLATNINFKEKNLKVIKNAIRANQTIGNSALASILDIIDNGFLVNPNITLEYVKEKWDKLDIIDSKLHALSIGSYNWDYYAVYRDRRNARIKRAERIKKLLSRVIMRDFLNIVCKYTDYN
jgi:hypothetical protein